MDYMVAYDILNRWDKRDLPLDEEKSFIHFNRLQVKGFGIY